MKKYILFKIVFINMVSTLLTSFALANIKIDTDTLRQSQLTLKITTSQEDQKKLLSTEKSETEKTNLNLKKF